VSEKMMMMISRMKVCTQSVRKVALRPPTMVYATTPTGRR